MDTDRAQRQVKDLLEHASRFWAGEAEAARTFFQAPRTKEEHIRWLRLQAYKELQPRTDGIILLQVRKLLDDYSRLEHGVDRHEYLHAVQFLEEEFRHYVLFADVLDELTGSKITPEELANYEYPEERELRRIRTDYKQQHGGLAAFASEFCEGGGSSLFYEGMQIAGDPISDKVAAACRGVHDDEVDHAAHGVQEMASMAMTDREWDLVWEMVINISRQRVRMRNEQFGFPLSEERLREIEEGKIELPERFSALLR